MYHVLVTDNANEIYKSYSKNGFVQITRNLSKKV